MRTNNFHEHERMKRAAADLLGDAVTGDIARQLFRGAFLVYRLELRVGLGAVRLIPAECSAIF